MARAAAVTGSAMILEAAAARLMLRADEASVYVLGRPIGWVCGLRSRLGLPCPTCGITRSVVLSLHGELGRAWQLAPAGPVVVFGLLAFAAALLVLAGAEWLGARKWGAAARSGLRRGALIYAGAATLVWIGGWVESLAAALHNH